MELSLSFVWCVFGTKVSLCYTQEKTMTNICYHNPNYWFHLRIKCVRIRKKPNAVDLWSVNLVQDILQSSTTCFAYLFMCFLCTMSDGVDKVRNWHKNMTISIIFYVVFDYSFFSSSCFSALSGFTNMSSFLLPAITSQLQMRVDLSKIHWHKNNGPRLRNR